MPTKNNDTHILEDNKNKSEGIIIQRPLEDAYSLFLFGTRGSFPVTGSNYAEFGGSTTCYVFKKGKHAVIWDCGTGLLDAKDELKDCEKIDILISHMHYDHCIGLLGWFFVFPPNAEINFYGNFDQWFGKQTISELFRGPFWPVDPLAGKEDMIHPLSEFNGRLELDDDILIEFYDAPHPNHSCIANVHIGSKKISLMVDFGSLDGPPAELIEGADLLIYDGMYDDGSIAGKEGWGHSTWQSAVNVAARANVGQLIIAHHDPDSWDRELRAREKEAKKIFPNTEFARSGERIVFW